jgi:hypothetical protein
MNEQNMYFNILKLFIFVVIWMSLAGLCFFLIIMCVKLL